MSRLFRLGCLIVLCLLLSAPAAAQDNANPLMDMLRLVPDNEQTRVGIPIISYADYRAIEQARGIATPPTNADFSNRTETASLWIAATNGLTSGMRLNNFMQYVEGMEQAVGFSWFDIDRALVFGQLPSMGTILMGTFDADAIAGAFEARDFTAEEQDGATVWCASSGCENGQRTNLASRDPANPFGGDLGREEPIALLPNAIVNSADYTVLEAILAADQGAQPSLADDPYARAAATVIASKGTLRQAQFYNSADISDYGDMVATEGEQPELLPAYSLAFFADTYEGEEQSALVGLVYDDEESAQTAATLLVDHLQMAQSEVAERPFMELIEDRGGNIAGAAVEADAETGTYIALLDIRYPMPPDEKQDGKYIASSLVFKLLIDAIYRRDASWLAADFAAPQ